MNKEGNRKKRGAIVVEEPTGSAPMINLDGRWEQDFDDHAKKNKKSDSKE